MYSKEINAKKIQEAKDNFVKEIKETSLEYSERLSKKYGGNIFFEKRRPANN